MAGRKKQKPGSLANGRPPLVKSARTMSRKASRTTINRHHQLQKQRHHASLLGDREREMALSLEIAKLGGLDQYQQASLQGQSSDRGGDTSKVLLEWLPVTDLKLLTGQARLLEIGSLSTKNACSTSGLFDVVHIDLNSQEPGIQKQDFMERPLPTDDSQRFDIISLSLVLNFVPEHATRGRMLTRTLKFLRNTLSPQKSRLSSTFPSLFIVLPRSCVDNSRYFTQDRLAQIMGSLGYTLLNSKLTQKLAYSLWKWDGAKQVGRRSFGKEELKPGRIRNNFVITLKNTVQVVDQ
jgi:25S rRNA (adenine2142-N1)-methyltransferase